MRWANVMNGFTKGRKCLSLILKIVVIVSAVAGTALSAYAARDTFMGGSRVFMYFTIQSNIAVALISAVGLCMLLSGRNISKALHVIKFVGAVSITLTGVVFAFVLAPTLGSKAWNLQNTLTHVVVPIAAVLDFFAVSSGAGIRKQSVVYVTIPPILYAIYAGIGYVRGWEFAENYNYPYFFLNWGSPAGALGFSNGLPFMGTVWWIIAILIFLIAVGLGYLAIAAKLGGQKEKEFDIQEYMTRGVERVVADALAATVKNPKESAFMLGFAKASKRASKKRKKAEAAGEHIPPFLIASITSSCNLHCAGCYSRCNHATVDTEPVSQLDANEWAAIFDEADELGVSFILLAGGEPMLRRDVIEAASTRKNMLFPIFTNGTCVDNRYFELFDEHRNLIPIMSIEGGKEITDARRGKGIYEQLIANMDEFKKRGLIFGASVTVTTENLKEVTSEDFLRELSDRGCKAVIFVEFVPVTDESTELAPGDQEREYLKREIARLRKEKPEMVYISFPGDEKGSGGCVAAGRGFFHINSHGGAEPCPFSPYSDVNIRNSSLREAMHSPLFMALQSGDILMDDHEGGCVLYEKRELVEQLMRNTFSA